jgi:hypothetical protein
MANSLLESLAEIHLYEGQKSLFDVSFLLNESPMSYLNYNHPKDAFRKLYFKDGDSPGNRQIKNNVININDHRPPKTKS